MEIVEKHLKKSHPAISLKKNYIAPSSSKSVDTDTVFGPETPQKYQDHLLEASLMLTDHFYTEINTMRAVHLCTSLLSPQYLLRYLSNLQLLKTGNLYLYR